MIRRIIKFKFPFLAVFLSIILISILLSVIPVKLLFAIYKNPIPQAIFMLGGEPNREYFAATFALDYPELPIWISSRQPPEKLLTPFQKANISTDRIRIDNRAADTVTNFTSLVQDFQSQDINNVFLITSDVHMARAKAIAFWVFGSRGIWCTAIEVPGGIRKETAWRTFRDILRSWLWLLINRTGAGLHLDLSPLRPN